MNRILQFWAYDLTVTWRESSNRIFLLFPPLFLLVVVYGFPAIFRAWPASEAYGLTMLMLLALQGGILFGFVTGFSLLDEKDQGIIPVFRVAPVRMQRLLFLKLTFPFLITLTYELLLFHLNPVLPLSGWILPVAALIFSLVLPWIALLIGALGRNKVEGLTYFKGIDLAALAPLLAAFLPGSWKWVFAIFPTFWTTLGLVEYGDQARGFMLPWIVAALFQLGLILFAVRLFQRRT